MAMDPRELRGAIEAILFAATGPVSLDELVESFSDEGREAVVAQLDHIKGSIEQNIAGFTLEQAAGGWRFATRAEHDPVLRKFFSKKGEGRLSIAALETLAIIAYRQPITTPEISDIRGVNATGVIRTLLERKMIRVAGRKNVVGSPFLYRTTREFLLHFGLNDIQDLPRLEEFADLIGENIVDDLASLPTQASMFDSSPMSMASAEAVPAQGSAEEPRSPAAPLRAVPHADSIGEMVDDATIDRELREQGVTDIPDEERGEDMYERNEGTVESSKVPKTNK